MPKPDRFNSHDRERRRDPTAPAKPRFKALTMQDGTLEMLIYGEIVDAGTIAMLEDWGVSTDGLVSLMNVKRAMDAGPFSRIRLRINSPGGDAFEGMAIHNLVAGCGKPVDVIVDGVAASAAAIVAMAGGTREMGPVSMLMIHNAWSSCTGNKAAMIKKADTLDTIDQTIASAFMVRTGQTQAEIQALMDAETWLTAQDCVDQGFATHVAEVPEEESSAAVAMARSFRTMNRWHNIPDTFRGAVRNDDPDDNANGCQCECRNCGKDDCSNCSSEDCQDKDCQDCPMQGQGTSDLSLQEAIYWQLAHGIGVSVDDGLAEIPRSRH